MLVDNSINTNYSRFINIKYKKMIKNILDFFSTDLNGLYILIGIALLVLDSLIIYILVKSQDYMERIRNIVEDKAKLKYDKALLSNALSNEKINQVQSDLNKIRIQKLLLTYIEKLQPFGNLYWLLDYNENVDYDLKTWCERPEQKDFEDLHQKCQWTSKNNNTIGVSPNGNKIELKDGVYRTSTIKEIEFKDWISDGRRKGGGYYNTYYKNQNVYCIVKQGNFEFVNEDKVNSRTAINILCIDKSIIKTAEELKDGLSGVLIKDKKFKVIKEEAEIECKKNELQNKSTISNHGMLSNSEVEEIIKQNPPKVILDKISVRLWEIQQKDEKGILDVSTTSRPVIALFGLILFFLFAEGIDCIKTPFSDSKSDKESTVETNVEDNLDLGITNWKVNGHEYVDLGLPSGRLWATCNIGATKPTEYGDYYAWGEIKQKTKYSEKTYETKMSRYSYTERNLYSEDDVASVKWGKGWRVPSIKDVEELMDGCNWMYITNSEKNNVTGELGTSKYNGNKIFIPAGGRRRGKDIEDVNQCCWLWSSTLYAISFVEGCCFSDGYYDFSSKKPNYGARADIYDGLNVRPVFYK